LGRLDHCQPDPILDTAGGIKKFELGDDRRLRVVHTTQAHQRRVANQLSDVVVDPAHHTPFICYVCKSDYLLYASHQLPSSNCQRISERIEWIGTPTFGLCWLAHCICT